MCFFSLRFASDFIFVFGDVKPALNMIKTRGNLYVTIYRISDARTSLICCLSTKVFVEEHAIGLMPSSELYIAI